MWTKYLFTTTTWFLFLKKIMGYYNPVPVLILNDGGGVSFTEFPSQQSPVVIPHFHKGRLAAGTKEVYLKLKQQ